MERYDIQVFIESKKAFYKKLIEDSSCDNKKELEKRINNWTDEDWMSYMEQEFSSIYKVDRITKTFTKI